MKKDTYKCETCVHNHPSAINVCNKCDQNYNKYIVNKSKIRSEPMEEKIFEYIKKVYNEKNYTPSYTDMSNRFKCSKQTINHYMLKLEDRNDIVFNPHRRAYFLRKS